MKHSHMWLCGAFAALTVVLAVAGAGAFALIPAAGCAVTCASMVWSMVRDANKRRATHA
jgi:hypothetical protein